MSVARRQERPSDRQEMGGVERLGIRVSSMINHPIAQLQRWVTIHRLDTDGDREWNEVMGVLAETDEVNISFNDDGAVTVKWEAVTLHDLPIADADFELDAEPAPF